MTARPRRPGHLWRPFAACLALLAAQHAAAALTPRLRPQAGDASARVAQVVGRVRAGAGGEETLREALALGHALVAARRYAEAEQLYGALVERWPREPSALYGAALAAFNLGRAREAEPLARASADISLAASAEPKASPEVSAARMRGAADALVLLGVILAVRGDDAAALKTVERAAALAPEHFDAQFALGRARYGAGDVAGAVRAFRAAVALRPDDARALFFHATALERAGETERALAAYRELAARHPNLADGHLGLGALLYKRGGEGAREAVEALRRAVSLNPNLYEARVTLGRALVSLGRAEESIEHLRRAAELAPNNPEPHYQLALAYRRLGRREDAARESAIVRRIHEARRAGANPPAPGAP